MAAQRDSDWHAVIGDATLADAICDRLVHNAHRVAIQVIGMPESVIGLLRNGCPASPEYAS